MSRFWQVLLALVLAGSVLMDVFGPAKEAYHVWDHKGFFAVFGFVGCVAIIFVSKAIGKLWLQREPDYYEPFHAPEPGGSTGSAHPATSATDAPREGSDA